MFWVSGILLIIFQSHCNYASIHDNVDADDDEGNGKTFLIVSNIVVSYVKPLNLLDMATRIRFTWDEKKDDKCDKSKRPSNNSFKLNTIAKKFFQCFPCLDNLLSSNHV